MKKQCSAPKYKKATVRCPHQIKSGSIYCGKHQKCNIILNTDVLEGDESKMYISEKTPKKKDLNIGCRIIPTEIFTYEKYQEDPFSIKKLNMQNIRNSLQFYSKDIKGKKKDILKRLEDHFALLNFGLEKRIEICLVQGILRRKMLFYGYGPAIANRSICMNTEDYLLGENIKDIEREMFFSYSDNEFTYGFRIDSFKQLIDAGYNNNPYNFKEIPEIAKEMLSHRIMMDDTPINDGYANINLTNEENIFQRALQIFSKIDELGNYTDHRWFTMLTMKKLQKMYETIEDIWFYRAELDSNTKLRICNKNEVFNIKPSEVYTWTLIKKMALQKLLLDHFEIFIYSSKDKDDQSLGALLILTAIVEVSEDAAYSLPHLVQSLWGV